MIGLEREQLGATGDFIRELRKARGLTVRELAELSGVSYSAISRYETGDRQPPVHIFEQLVNALGGQVYIAK